MITRAGSSTGPCARSACGVGTAGCRSDIRGSSSLPLGVALLGERGDALAPILTGHGLAPGDVLELDAVVERHLDAAVDGPLRFADRHRRRPAQLLGELDRAFLRLGAGDHAV